LASCHWFTPEIDMVTDSTSISGQVCDEEQHDAFSS
jgi:hypothetical protein